MDFTTIENSVRERNAQIRVAKAQIPTFLEINENLKVIVAPEHETQAREIAALLTKLRNQNEADLELRKKALEIEAETKIPLERLHKLDTDIAIIEKWLAEHTAASPAAIQEARARLEVHRTAKEKVDALLNSKAEEPSKNKKAENMDVTQTYEPEVETAEPEKQEEKPEQAEPEEQEQSPVTSKRSSHKKGRR